MIPDVLRYLANQVCDAAPVWFVLLSANCPPDGCLLVVRTALTRLPRQSLLIACFVT